MTYHLLYADVTERGEDLLSTGSRVIGVAYCNGVHMGEMFADVDGYFKWWPLYPGNAGYIDAWVLRELADKLDDLNKEWDAIVQRDCGPAGATPK